MRTVGASMTEFAVNARRWPDLSIAYKLQAPPTKIFSSNVSCVPFGWMLLNHSIESKTKNVTYLWSAGGNAIEACQCGRFGNVAQAYTCSALSRV